MNEKEALTYLSGVNRYDIKLGLETITQLLEELGNPQNDLECIHMTGTNGKGSTLAFVKSMMIAAGYRVGVYTSPALEVFNERIQINNQPIGDIDLDKVTATVKNAGKEIAKKGFSEPTEFELVTAIAFLYFKQQGVDLVLLEVGMGGRTDATNVLKRALVSVITPIALDHTDFLGDSIAKIAYEKAGIIKRGTRAVIHPQEEEAYKVIQEACEALGVTLEVAPVDKIEWIEEDTKGVRFKLGDQTYQISLLGAHQARNAVVALSVIKAINDSQVFVINPLAISEGLKNAFWPGRLEILHTEPYIIIDGAHNLHGAKSLSSTLAKLFPNRKMIGIVGILGDKDVSGILDEMMPLMTLTICTEPNNPRRLNAEHLATQISNYGVECFVERDYEKAFELAIMEQQKDPDQVIVCFGSLYLIGQMRQSIKKALFSQK